MAAFPEIDHLLRSDADFLLERGSEHRTLVSCGPTPRVDCPVWLVRSDWTAQAEVRVFGQTRMDTGVEVVFRVLHAYTGAESDALTVIFRRMFAGLGDPFIYLLMNPADFERATREGTWDPPSRAVEGFIHASPRDQLTRVANKHYRQFDALQVVFLRHQLLRAEVLWEPAAGNLYPHVYGPIDMAAAERHVLFPRGADGTFTIELGDP